MRLIFWFSLFWVVYAYGGYLAILTAMTLFKKNRCVEDSDFTPSVALIISAHNEEKVIKRKMEESLDLDYPKDDLEIIIASDASTDRTDDIVKSFHDKGVILVRQDARGGKTAAQNLAVSKTASKILVFSDATTVFEKAALRKLVRHFSDPRIGCVGGEEGFIKSEEDVSAEAGFFWKYEKLIRKKECRFNTAIGVSGCIFAIRRELYEPLEETLIEDFALPLKVAAKGFRVVSDEEAVAYEKAADSARDELMRKSRIVSGGINCLFKLKHLLNPLKHPLLAFQLISHKIFRWLAPVFMITLLISSMELLTSGTAFFALGILQMGFYSLAILGYLFKDYYRAPRAMRLIYHFCLVNLAAVLGIVRFVRGERRAIWEPVR